MKIGGYNIDVGKMILSGIAYKLISDIFGNTSILKGLLGSGKRRVKKYKKPTNEMLINSYYYDWKDELYNNIRKWKNASKNK